MRFPNWVPSSTQEHWKIARGGKVHDVRAIGFVVVGMVGLEKPPAL